MYKINLKPHPNSNPIVVRTRKAETAIWGRVRDSVKLRVRTRVNVTEMVRFRGNPAVYRNLFVSYIQGTILRVQTWLKLRMRVKASTNTLT